MAKKFSFSKNPGMVITATFVIMYVVNALVLYVTNMLFPQQVVLGTMTLTPAWAIVLSMSALSVLLTLVVPFVHEAERVMERDLKSAEWMGLYLALNFAGIWLISRFSEQFGLGVSSWMVVLALALVMNVLQAAAMMQFEKFRKSLV
jgi:hypothetical protein